MYRERDLKKPKNNYRRALLLKEQEEEEEEEEQLVKELKMMKKIENINKFKERKTKNIHDIFIIRFEKFLSFSKSFHELLYYICIYLVYSKYIYMKFACVYTFAIIKFIKIELNLL
jgi:hypothetical protein